MLGLTNRIYSVPSRHPLFAWFTYRLYWELPTFLGLPRPPTFGREYSPIHHVCSILTDSRFVEVNLFIICGSMPTFRKFLKRFLPKWMGSSGHSHPSKPTTFDTSQSKLHRQPHTGYTQFDIVELDNFSEHKKEGVIQATVADVESKGSGRDDTSEEAILDERSIAHTKTFQVQYSA